MAAGAARSVTGADTHQQAGDHAVRVAFDAAEISSGAGDGDINQHCVLLHQRKHIPRDKLGSAGARDKDGPDDNIGR